ncbi:MAG: hypothetical protein NVSMB9_09050 [Isosphaeraceae bacterium]
MTMVIPGRIVFVMSLSPKPAEAVTVSLSKRKLTPALQQPIEGLALRKPRLSSATVHLEVAEAARKLGQEPPSYKVVHAVIGKLEPALLTLAHESSKAYSEAFDLVHRGEADAPIAVRQADQTV